MAKVIRIIIYNGTKEWLDATLGNSFLPENGVRLFPNNGTISSFTIHDDVNEEQKSD